MIDLSKNTTPWGLLDEETKDFLDAWGGDVEVWDYGAEVWRAAGYSTWEDHRVYRTVPKPTAEVLWVKVVDAIKGGALCYAYIDVIDDEPVLSTLRQYP